MRLARNILLTFVTPFVTKASIRRGTSRRTSRSTGAHRTMAAMKRSRTARGRPSLNFPSLRRSSLPLAHRRRAHPGPAQNRLIPLPVPVPVTMERRHLLRPATVQPPRPITGYRRPSPARPAKRPLGGAATAYTTPHNANASASDRTVPTIPMDVAPTRIRAGGAAEIRGRNVCGAWIVRGSQIRSRRAAAPRGHT